MPPEGPPEQPKSKEPISHRGIVLEILNFFSSHTKRPVVTKEREKAASRLRSLILESEFNLPDIPEEDDVLKLEDFFKKILAPFLLGDMSISLLTDPGPGMLFAGEPGELFIENDQVKIQIDR